uniref:N-acetylgalactosaminide beta-1,3-galactosyltransferase n=1 Tax=Strongyloides venezuelensis TaxID=75913 RepID=A0A0K0FPU0_STRVS
MLIIRNYFYYQLVLFIFFYQGSCRAFVNRSVNNTIDEVFNKVENILFNDVTIFCLILTGPQYRKSRASYQKKTWIRGCNSYMYISSVRDPTLPSIALKVKEGKNNLWGKIKYGLRYVFNNYYRKPFDWFMLADDDTYVSMTNLRFLLITKNTSLPFHHGYRVKWHHSDGRTVKYVHGGGGDVLSREAFKRLVRHSLNNPKKCNRKGNGAGDFELSYCLINVGVRVNDGRDFINRPRFNPTNPLMNLASTYNHKFDKTMFRLSEGRSKHGIRHMPDYPISYHYLPGEMMLAIHYLLNIVNVVGKMNTLSKRLTTINCSKQTFLNESLNYLHSEANDAYKN